MRDRLVELLRKMDENATITCPRYSNSANLDTCEGCQYNQEDGSCDYTARDADYLLANGVIVTPCVAMVEQVLKDGKMDRPKTVHYAGKYSVVYVDKSKWKIPLIDITEQCYNDEKALERIQALKGGVE